MSGFNFDPDAYIRRAEPTARPSAALPDDWVSGLDQLLARACPRSAKTARWEQVVADALRLSDRHADAILEAGWSTENIFGFDPKQSQGFIGLAVALRGAVLVRITSTEATMRTGNVYRIHRPLMPSGCSMLWNFDDDPEASR